MVLGATPRASRSRARRATSWHASVAAAETFNDATLPCIGTRTRTSHRSRVKRASPRPSAPSTNITDWSASARSNSDCSPRSSRPTLQTLCRAPRSIAAGIPPTKAIGRYSIAPAAAFATTGVTRTLRCRGQHDAGCARGLRGPHHRAQVARIGDSVERDEERPRRVEQIIEIYRSQRFRRRDDSLVPVAARARREALEWHGAQARCPRVRRSRRSHRRVRPTAQVARSAPIGASRAGAPSTARRPSIWSPPRPADGAFRGPSGPAPDRAVGRVFERDPPREQLVADAVGGGEVLAGPGFVACGHQARRSLRRAREPPPWARCRARLPAPRRSRRASRHRRDAARPGPCSPLAPTRTRRPPRPVCRSRHPSRRGTVHASAAATSGRLSARALRTSASMRSSAFSASASSVSPNSICLR